MFIVFILFVLRLVESSDSFFFTNETSTINSFTTGEWHPANTTVLLKKGEKIYTSQNNIRKDANLYFVNSTEDNQFLCFTYKLSNEETASGFSIPSVVVFFDEIEILQLSNRSENKQVSCVDLTTKDLEIKEYRASYIIQNFYDENFETQFSFEDVTTQLLPISHNEQLIFKTSKEVKNISVEYSYIQNGVETQHKEKLVLNENNEYTFVVPDFLTQLNYWSTDLYGNIEEKQILEFYYFENKLDNLESSFELFSETENEINMQLEYVNQDTTPKEIEVYLSDEKIIIESELKDADKLTVSEHKKYQKTGIEMQYSPGVVRENILFRNVPSGNHYFTVRLCNSFGVCSAIIDSKLLLVE